MREACSLVRVVLVGFFRSSASLEAEIELVLRNQFNIMRRQSPKRLTFSILDRLICRTAPNAGVGAVWDRVVPVMRNRLPSESIDAPNSRNILFSSCARKNNRA